VSNYCYFFTACDLAKYLISITTVKIMQILGYSTCVWCPGLGWSHWSFTKILGIRKVVS